MSRFHRSAFFPPSHSLRIGDAFASKLSSRLAMIALGLVTLVGFNSVAVGQYPNGSPPPPNGWESNGSPNGPQYGPMTDEGYSGNNRNVPSGSDQALYELVPSAQNLFYGRGFDGVTLGELLRGSWVYGDYGQSSFRTPGRTLLGAPLSGVDNPALPFTVTLPNGKDEKAIVPTTAFVTQRHINSFRGGVGIPFSYGSIEANWYGTTQTTDGFGSLIVDPRRVLIAPNSGLGAGGRLPIVPIVPQVTGVVPTTVATPFNVPFSFYGTSLLSNGVPGSLVILYDHGFVAQYASRYTGGDLNMVFNVETPQYGPRLMVTGGYKQVNYTEVLKQYGQFDGTSLLASPDPTLLGSVVDPTTYKIYNPPLTNFIGSSVQNNLYGGTVGLRTEYAQPLFTLGVDNRVGVAVNNYTANVQTNHLRDSLAPLTPLITDPHTSSTIHHSQVTPTFDMRAYTKIHVTDSFNVNLGYNFNYVNNMARAANTINYNDTGLNNAPAVTAKTGSHSFWAHGWTIGCEYILP